MNFARWSPFHEIGPTKRIEWNGYDTGADPCIGIIPRSMLYIFSSTSQFATVASPALRAHFDADSPFTVCLESPSPRPDDGGGGRGGGGGSRRRRVSIIHFAARS